MGIGYGPRIVTNGLVFAYDQSNTDKSWKGAPATNAIFASPSWSGDGTDQGAFAGGSVEITDPNLMYNGLKTFLYSPKSSLNCYLQGSGSDFPGSNASTVWTFSCYVKREDGAAISSMQVYMYYPSSDGSAAGTIEDVGNGWYRIYRTRTGASNDIGLAGFTSMAGSVKYYLSGAMLTKTDVPVRGLAGTASRSSTQALLDLTNNEAITAQSLTYAADDTFSFDGVTDYISNTMNLGSDPLFSVNLWIKRTAAISNGGYWGFGGNGSGNGISGYTNVAHKIGWDLWGLTTFHTGVDYPLDEWVNVCWVKHSTTFTTSTLKIYINGVEAPITTTVRDGGSAVSLVSGFSVGRISVNNATYLGTGEVPLCQVYNRALTAAEVAQNFNTHRGRFGI